ncbi:MAG TPA: PAS domain S-box protein [Chryseosolibacter sp.]|nr:PAS domain S-box protein [Chryseosolibacter sp.]
MKSRAQSIILFILAVIIILAVHVLDYRHTAFMIASFHDVEEAQQTITRINKLASQLKDIQRAHRGYILTQKSEFLFPYEQASETVPELLKELSQHMAASEQQRLLDSLREKTFRKLSFVEASILKVDAGHADEAAASIAHGKKLFDQMTSMISRIETSAKARTDELRTEVRRHERINRIVVLAGLFLSVGMITIALVSLYRSQRKAEALGLTLDKANTELKAANEEFRTTNESLEQSRRKLLETQRALESRENQLLQAQRISKTGSIDWNIATDVINYTDEFARIMRFKAGSHYTFKDLMNNVHTDDRTIVWDQIANAIKTRSRFQSEFRLKFDDDIVNVLVVGEPMTEHGSGLFYVGALTDITAGKKAQEEIRVSEEKFRAVLEAAPDPMIIADADGIIRLVNKQTERLFQYGREELIGQQLEVLLPFRFRTNVIGLRGTSLQNHRLSEYGIGLTLNGLRKDGSEVPVEINFSPIETTSENLIAASIRDVTLQKEAEAKIMEANAQLERGNEALQKANNELSSFSYSISHDLRAPLRAINGYSAILHEDYGDILDDRAKKALRTIQENATRMDSLINDLLELARLGYTSIEKQSVNMQQLVNAIIMEKNIDKPKIAVAPMDLSHGDATLLRQVWENLINNALKFSSKNPDAAIEVGFQQGQNEQIFFVRDNGVGFDATYSDKLFKVFSRLHAKHEFEGTGAGLAIVKKIIDAHGGRVWAESSPGNGATFFFALPLG